MDPGDQQLIGQELVPVVSLAGQDIHEAFLMSAQEPALAAPAIQDRSPILPEQRSEANGMGGTNTRDGEGDQVPPMPLGVPQSFGPVSQEEMKSPEGLHGGASMVPLFDQEQLNRLHALQQQAAWMYSTRMAGEVVRPQSLGMDAQGQRPERYDIYSPPIGSAALLGGQGANPLLLEELQLMRQSQLELRVENMKLKKEMERIQAQGEQNAKFYTPEKGDPDSPRVGRCPDPKELPSFRGASSVPECQGPSVRLCPNESQGLNEQRGFKECQGEGRAQDVGRERGQGTTSAGDPTFPSVGEAGGRHASPSRSSAG